jgi:hypothetical protein
VFPKNGVERNRPLFLRLGKGSSRIAQIHGVLCGFQLAEIVGGDNCSNGLTVTFDNHPLAAVLGTAKDIRKVVLGLGDGHSCHGAIMAHLACRDNAAARRRLRLIAGIG